MMEIWHTGYFLRNIMWINAILQKCRGTLQKTMQEKFAEGVNIGTEDEPEITMPGKLDIIKSDDLSEIRLTIQEGKFHQVKRMFQAVGKEVVYLKRERMGSLVLDG